MAKESVSTLHDDNIHHIYNASEESDVFICQDDKVFLRATEHLSGSVNQPGWTKQDKGAEWLSPIKITFVRISWMRLHHGVLK